MFRRIGRLWDCFLEAMKEAALWGFLAVAALLFGGGVGFGSALWHSRIGTSGWQLALSVLAGLTVSVMVPWLFAPEERKAMKRSAPALAFLGWAVGTILATRLGCGYCPWPF